MDHRTMSSAPHTTFVAAEETPMEAIAYDALDLVLQRVKLRAQRRRLWLREILRLEAPDGTEANYHTLIAHILLGRDQLGEENAWQAQAPELVALNIELAWVEDRLHEDRNARLSALVINFGLSPVETAVLHTCIALAQEPQLERVCSYLQDHNGRGFVTLQLVSKLFGLEYQVNATELHALRSWRFMREVPGAKGEPALLEIDPWIQNWLRGQNTLDPILIGRAQFPALAAPIENWPIEDAMQQIERILEHNPQQKVRLCVQGLDGSGRQTFAALLAERFGLPMLSIDTDNLSPEDWSDLHLHAQRQAYLSGLALLWRGDDLADKAWPKDVVPVQLQFAAISKEQILQAQAGVVDLKIALQPLNITIRKQLWEQLVPMSQAWDPEILSQLVTRYQTTVGQIAMVGRRAAATPADAIEILRDHSRHRLGKLAQLLPATFVWQDLSLHPMLLESLQDFVFEAQERETWWESGTASRLFPQGKGLMALFSGPSGTGKTMTAQVIAAALRLDLFRIDLSSVISKYVGETSKHIDRILTQAQSMHAVLLFDEADTLFGKRTDIKDAHDRFANADTNFLLQAIENYPGVAILATNRKANIDAAFLRRLRFVFEFNKPDASQRLQLWELLLSEMVGRQAVAEMAEPLRQIALMIDLTGAQIKYAVLSAVFVARREGRPLGINQVLKGIERELAKEGKGLSPETAKRLDYFKR
jgi:adenylate kinase family enzyme